MKKATPSPGEDGPRKDHPFAYLWIFMQGPPLRLPLPGLHGYRDHPFAYPSQAVCFHRLSLIVVQGQPLCLPFPGFVFC